MDCCPGSLLKGPISLCCSGVTSGRSVPIREFPPFLSKCTGSFLFSFFNQDRIIVTNIKESDPIIKPMDIIKIVYVKGPTCLFPIRISFYPIVSSLRNSSFFLKGLIFQGLLGVLYLRIFLSKVPIGPSH